VGDEAGKGGPLTSTGMAVAGMDHPAFGVGIHRGDVARGQVQNAKTAVEGHYEANQYLIVKR